LEEPKLDVHCKISADTGFLEGNDVEGGKSKPNFPKKLLPASAYLP
jgi:hypothetical protein